MSQKKKKKTKREREREERKHLIKFFTETEQVTDGLLGTQFGKNQFDS